MRYHVRVMKASLGRSARPAAAARRQLLALLAGQLISWTGNRISAVALPLLVIERYGVGLSLGLIAATRLVPRVLLGPWAGALVDRLPRRATVAAANVASAGLVALIPFTTSLPQLYLLGAALGVVETLLRPASFALLPEVFPKDDLYRVNAAQEIIDAVSNLAGPALAIALVTGLGVGGAFAVDAASFLLAALSLAALRPLPAAEHPAAPAAGAPAAGAGSFGAAWRILRDDRDGSLPLLLAVNAVYTLGIGALLVLYAPLALGPLGAGEWGFGALVTATGLGALLGVLLAPRFGPRLTPRRLLAQLALSGLLLLAAGPLRAFWPVAILLTLAHIPESFAYLVFATESQRRVPARLLGRYYGVAMTILAAALPLGNLLGGLGAARLDPRIGVSLVGAGFIAAALAGLALAPRLGRAPDAERQAPAAGGE